MTLELMSIPLALLAGILGIMSPCVWPLVPVVMSSAATSGRTGPVALALGLSTSFAVAGTLLTLMLLNLGLDPVIFRHFAAALLFVVGLLLVVKPLGDWLTMKLSSLTSRFDTNANTGSGFTGQFALGALLGLVWLPCVGPTLGAAIALASMGQDIPMAFVVMLTFGLGTASALLLAGFASGAVLKRWRPDLMNSATQGKLILGWLLLALSLMVFTGVDKILEKWALDFLPSWALTL